MRMSAIRPFRAVRPARDTAAAVSSVPYDVVNTEEARQLAAGNPLSFRHVRRAEIDRPAGTDPYSQQVYGKARRQFAALRISAPLVEEDEPSVYFYRLRMGGHEQTGIAACFSVDEYEQDVIKKHERTRRDKEDDRTRHIIELRAQTGLVLLTYRASEPIDRLCRAVTADAPLYDFRADDGVHHTIWRVKGQEATALVDAFAHVPALYIADGHHRAASAGRARAEMRARGDSREADTFIAVAFPSNQMRILPYNRVVKDLVGRTPDQFLAALGARLPVRDGSAIPRGKGDVAMFLAGTWYGVDLSGAAPLDRSRANALDVALLQHHVLEPLPAIGDVRIDKRIDFVGGARRTAALEAAADTRTAAAAFSLDPGTLHEPTAIS